MKNNNRRFRLHVVYVFTVTLTIFILGVIALHSQHNQFKQRVENGDITILGEQTPQPDPNLLTEENLITLIHQSQPKVVTISVTKKDGTYLGSGFLYNLKGDIVTNAHVVEGAISITVKLADETEYAGKLIGVGKEIDVAVVRVKKLAGVEPLNVSRLYSGEIGSHIVALGSPLGLEKTVTTGIISGLNRTFSLEDFEYIDTYQISAPISPGSSGGPLLDRTTGEVIGINSAKINSETIGFSIPIVHVLPILENWSKYPDGFNPSKSDDGPPEYN